MVVRFAGLTWEVLIAWRGAAPDATLVPVKTTTMSTDPTAAAAADCCNHPLSSRPSQPACLMNWTICTMPRNRPPAQLHIEGAPESTSIELPVLAQQQSVALADSCRLLGVLAVSVARETVARGSYHPRKVEDPARPPFRDALDRECRHRFLLLLADLGLSDLGTA